MKCVHGLMYNAEVTPGGALMHDVTTGGWPSTSALVPLWTNQLFTALDWRVKLGIVSLSVSVQKNEMDTSNFDSQFTSEPAVQTVVDSKIDPADQAKFQGFTFMGESELDK